VDGRRCGAIDGGRSVGAFDALRRGACLSIFDDQCFYGQAHRHAGARPHIHVDAFAPAADVTAVFDADGWLVSSALVDHHPVEPAVGYRIERAGIAVTVSGDTGVCDGIQRLAERTDVLVHEALLAAAVSPALLEWNAGARQVGELTAVTQPGTLVLTHMIPAPNTPATTTRSSPTCAAEATTDRQTLPTTCSEYRRGPHSGIDAAVPDSRRERFRRVTPVPTSERRIEQV
jgi:hypothetical protein